MNFSPKIQFYINQLKSNLKFLVIGILVISLLAFGFVVSMTLLLAVIIAVPVIRMWQSYKFKNKPKSKGKYDIDDFIDVEYEIVERKTVRKKKEEKD